MPSRARSKKTAGETAMPTFLGLAVHMSPGLTAGTAVVLDSQAVIAVEHTDSPVVVVDPYSKSDTNTIRVVSDVVAGFAVIAPGSVVSVTKSA
jgi:hypothetical protein